jgi:hypothetical protein
VAYYLAFVAFDESLVPMAFDVLGIAFEKEVLRVFVLAVRALGAEAVKVVLTDLHFYVDPRAVVAQAAVAQVVIGAPVHHVLEMAVGALAEHLLRDDELANWLLFVVVVVLVFALLAPRTHFLQEKNTHVHVFNVVGKGALVPTVAALAVEVLLADPVPGLAGVIELLDLILVVELIVQVQLLAPREAAALTRLESLAALRGALPLLSLV